MRAKTKYFGRTTSGVSTEAQLFVTFEGFFFILLPKKNFNKGIIQRFFWSSNKKIASSKMTTNYA